MCMTKIFRGAGVVTPSNPPPCFKMFLERSLNDPTTTPLQTSFTATPSPSTIPSPLKILIIHHFQGPHHCDLTFTPLKSVKFERKSNFMPVKVFCCCTHFTGFQAKHETFYLQIGRTSREKKKNSFSNPTGFSILLKFSPATL